MDAVVTNYPKLAIQVSSSQACRRCCTCSDLFTCLHQAIEDRLEQCGRAQYQQDL